MGFKPVSRFALLPEPIAALLFGLFAIGLLFSHSVMAKLSFEADMVKAKISALESASEQTAETKELILDYNNILSNLAASELNRQKADEFRKNIKENPQKTADIYNLIKHKQRTASSVILSVDKNSPLEQVEQSLLGAKATKNANEALLLDLDSLKLQNLKRPEKIGLELAEANRFQQETSVKLERASSDTGPSSRSDIKVAQNWLIESEAELARAKTEKLEQEMLSQQYRVEYIEAKRALTAFELNLINRRVVMLEELLGNLRQSEARLAKSRVEAEERQAEGKHSVVSTFAQGNTKTSSLLSEMVERLDQVTKQTTATEEQLQKINSDFLSLRNKIDIAGVTQAFGYVLLDQRRSLPDIKELSRRMSAREAELAKVGLLKFRHDEESRELVNINGYTNKLLAQVPKMQQEQVREELQKPISRRVTLLSKAQAVERALISALIAQDLAERRLITSVTNHSEFISTRLFWMRSSEPPSVAMITDLPDELLEFLSPAEWVSALKHMAAGFQSLFGVLGITAFLFLMSIRNRLRSTLERCSLKIKSIKTDQFSYTLQAFSIGFLVALPWPLLLYLLGVEMSNTDHAEDMAKSVAKAAIWVSGALYILKLVKVYLEPKGVAEAHFKWPKDRILLIRKQVRNLMIFALPLAFLVIISSNADVKTSGESLRRVFVVIFLLVLPVCWYKLFLPNDGAFSHRLMKAKASIFANFSFLWPVIFVGLPIVLAIAATAGYVYTSMAITGLLFYTMLLLLVLVCAYQFVTRWLLILQRRLRYQAAIDKREAAKIALQEKLEKGETKDEPQPGTEGFFEIETPELDINAISQETRELLGAVLVIVGLVASWFIWRDVLGSITFWSNVTLWEYVGKGDGADFLVPVTLFDVVVALFVFGVTIISANKFPALMEMLILQRFGVNAGERYAAKTLVRYGIISVGTLWVLSSIGASWNQIQWLAAAIGVGIGFGLQEIVANFISGLIILFERPIRVGDIVTVGDTDGVVTRIQIRATTIRNWDRKELLVPNKEFVTGRLLNWTLSDQTTRIIFPIGLAYGTDARAAMSLITEVAKENEHVLEDPAPFVSFESLGDNSIILYLRAYVGSMDYRLLTISELHTEVYATLNEQGYVISFPQRDLHIDTLTPLEIKLVQSEQAQT